MYTIMGTKIRKGRGDHRDIRQAPNNMGAIRLVAARARIHKAGQHGQHAKGEPLRHPAHDTVWPYPFLDRRRHRQHPNPSARPVSARSPCRPRRPRPRMLRRPRRYAWASLKCKSLQVVGDGGMSATWARVHCRDIPGHPL